VPHKYVTVEGIATYLHHRGPTTLPEVVPDLRQGEVVLCLHGAGGNGNAFAELLDLLAERHSPLAFDMPAHGRSGGIDSLGSIERGAAFTLALCDKLGLRPPVLLGHSLGGAVALRCALDRPDRVRALVLCSSGAHLGRNEAAVARLRRVTEGKAPREFAREAYSPKTPPEVLRRGFMEDLKTDPRARYGDLLAAQGVDLRPRLAEIALPVLLVSGGDEQPLGREQAEAMAAGIRGAQRVEIPGAAHMLPLEQPKALAEAVLAFLDGLPR
jgi:pimeloyl-ACP methyl ester carboxylesterase